MTAGRPRCRCAYAGRIDIDLNTCSGNWLNVTECAADPITEAPGYVPAPASTDPPLSYDTVKVRAFLCLTPTVRHIAVHRRCGQHERNTESDRLFGKVFHCLSLMHHRAW
jgi:hypothetical protein